MNNICKIEANPASGCYGTEPYVKGRTDDTRHTIIRPTFGRRIEKGKLCIYLKGYSSPSLKLTNEKQKSMCLSDLVVDCD